MPCELADGCKRSSPSSPYYTKEKKGNLLGSLRRSLGLVRMCRDTKQEFFKHNALGASCFLSPGASLNAVSCCDIWLGSSRAMSDTGPYNPWHRNCHYITCVPPQVDFHKHLCALCKHLATSSDIHASRFGDTGLRRTSLFQTWWVYDCIL